MTGLRPDVYGEDTPFPPPQGQTPAHQAVPAPQPQTPTQAAVADANRVEYGTDARGRKIGVRRLTMSTRRRAIKALSAESADKTQYVGLAAVACCVESIDGRTINFPTSEMILDALIDELDDDGFNCVNEVLRAHFPRREAESVKNS